MNGTAHVKAEGVTNQDFYDEFESYRFSDDPEFRSGLPRVIAAIRGQDRSADQIDEMIGRAQWFYFTRLKGVSIPWEEYARHQATQPFIHPNSPTLSPKAPRSPREALQALNNLAEARTMMKEGNGEVDGDGEGLSFGMLSRLISEGRAGEVPVKQIPEGTNESQPSQAVMQARPKPWEQASSLESPNRSQFTFHQPPPPSLPQPLAQGSGQIFPSLPQYHQRSSYSSSTNSPIFNQGRPGSSRSSYDAIYPSNQPANWASSGPTISPDLSFETFSLDPDFASLNSGPSSGLTTNTGSVGTPFDDNTFSNYLNADYDPLSDPNSNANASPYTNQNPINLEPPIQPFIATPAVGQAPPPAGQGGWTSDDTPASNYNL